MNAEHRRRSRKFDALVLGIVLGIAGTIAVYSFRSPEAAKPDAIRSAPSIVESPSVIAKPSTPAHPNFESDLLAALARIDALYAEREQEWRRTAAWVNTLLDSTNSESDERRAQLGVLRRKFEIRKQAEGSWDSMDDAFVLLYATLLAGDLAIEDFCAVAADESANMGVREEAIVSLGYLPSERSLRFLLDPPEDLAATGHSPTDSLERFAIIVDFLPTATVAPYSAELNALAANSLHDNPEDNHAWKLVAALGFEHNDANSLRLLNDPRMTGYFGKDLLQIAWWAGTDTSRAYIERMSRTNPSPEVRQKAADILAGWPVP